MTKTIDKKLKELDAKENRLKNQQKELTKLRKQLEAEKRQEEAKRQETEPYVEKFQELGLIFEHKNSQITIKPLDFERDEYLSFIQLVDSKATKDVLDNLLQTIQSGRMVEEHTPFKMSDFNNKMEFKVRDGEYIYHLKINEENSNYKIFITKENWDYEYNYRQKINKNISIAIEASGYDGFKVTWEYEAKTIKENLNQQINKALEVLKTY